MDSSNWRESLYNNSNFDQNVPYSLSLIENKLQLVQSDLEHFNPFYILSPIYEFTKFFASISSGLSMGFKDITSKVELMRVILKQHPEIENIQDLIEKEIKLNIHKLNGGNNSKMGHGSGDYKDYTSGARTFLRLLWFMEYLIHIFKQLSNDEQGSMKEILRKAYNEVLAPRHTWLVRQAVGIALTFSGGSKREVLKIIFGYDDFTVEAKSKIVEITNNLEKVWKAGTEFYKSKNIMQLP